MSEYGQSIPNNVIQLSNITGVSKSKFTQIFCQSLVQVGMKFIGSMSTYDILDPANAEVGDVMSYGMYGQFVFDFPSNESFTIGTTKYRPIIIVIAHKRDFNLGHYGNDSTNSFSIRLGRRRWDRLNTADIRTWWYYRVATANNGMSNPGDGGQEYMNGAWMRYKDGTPYDNSDPRWLPFIGASGGNGGASTYYKRSFNNLFMYLGTGGLYVAVGSDQSKTGFASWMSYMAVFAGGRIPGRANIPLSDVNLNRIMPVFDMPMHNGVYGPDFWDGTNLKAPLLGMQFDLKQRPDSLIYSSFLNLENVEQPIFPSYAPNVLRSPRIVNGSGAYVLSRPVIIPRYLFVTPSDLMGPVNNQITTVDVRPQWSDVFSAPNFRMGDRTVTPYQEYIDPTDNKHWYIIYAQCTNMAFAFDYTAKTIYNAISIARTNYGTINASMLAGFAGPFSDPQVISMVSTNDGAGPAWTPVAGQNEMQFTYVGVQYSNKDLRVTMRPDPSDPADTVYTLSMDIKFGCTVSQNPGSTHIQVFVYDTQNLAIRTVLILANSNPLAPQQNFQTFTMAIQRDDVINGDMQFLIRYHNDGYNDNMDLRVKNMVVTKSTYAPV